jgi:hypothetical protein
MSNSTGRKRRFLLRCTAAGLVTFAGAAVQAQTPKAAVTGQVELAPERQEHIWNIEHATFVIETYFGKPFRDALVAGKREQLLASFQPDFTGSVLVVEGAHQRRAGVVSETRRSATTSPGRAVDAAGLVDRLLEYRARFETIEHSRIQVMHADLVDHETGRWETEALLTIVGVGRDGGPLEHLSEHGVEFRFASDDVVKAGGPIVSRFTIRKAAERTAPRELMEEVTREVGIGEIPLPDNWKLPTKLARMHRYQFAVEDYDLDGYPDIAVAATNGRPLLLRSERGRRFVDVTEALGLRLLNEPPGERMLKALVGWIDYDNDAYPDLLMGSRLYHNDGGRRFVDVTSRSGLYFDKSPFGCVVADYDGDGLLDLYIVNQKGFRPRPPGKRPWVGDENAGTDNHLWHNEGGGRFRNVTETAHAGGGRHQTFAGVSFFLDDDPHPDLYLANDFGANVLLRNRGDGSFEDVTAASGTGDFSTSMGVSAGDLDNDGQPELYVANMYSKMGRRIVAQVRPEDYPEGLYEMIRGSLAGNRLYRPTGDGRRYRDITAGLGVNKVGWAFAPVMVDLDGDGWLDIYATTGFNSADRTKPDG